MNESGKHAIFWVRFWWNWININLFLPKKNLLRCHHFVSQSYCINLNAYFHDTEIYWQTSKPHRGTFPSSTYPRLGTLALGKLPDLHRSPNHHCHIQQAILMSFGPRFRPCQHSALCPDHRSNEHLQENQSMDTFTMAALNVNLGWKDKFIVWLLFV